MSREKIKKMQPNTGSQTSRREFLKYSAVTFGAMTLSSFAFGALGGPGKTKALSYPIDPVVSTTRQRMIAFPKTLPGLSKPQICAVEDYSRYGYGEWSFASPLPVMARTDIVPAKQG